MSDALTKSLPSGVSRPAFEKHREYKGTFPGFLCASTVNLKMPIVAYVIKLQIPFYFTLNIASFCAGG